MDLLSSGFGQLLPQNITSNEASKYEKLLKAIETIIINIFQTLFKHIQPKIVYIHATLLQSKGSKANE